ncbi:hypothetical protein BDM02DRAFT_2748052 [Thelephora ganbajun]|uniref:Uncharacterized protein n=1 Tax=Thelephora ganbajun TaxID=370292 RepID=A0ACB6ZRQ2_THEGA|nr:hypothetical protein BDM02DRAFT_2748052 [Thelephora ganbajun]
MHLFRAEDSFPSRIREDLESLTSTQSREQEEIKKLLEEALNNEVLGHLTKQIEKQVDVCIDNTVKKLVEAELENHVSKELRDQVDKQRSELLSLQIKIHNSEVKRANSFIKTRKQFGESLQYLLDEKGRPSDIFPKTVDQLLEYHDAKVLQLVKFYGMDNPDLKSKIPNLNWFLREIGVTYQSNLLG